jgi:hypothetical protein
MARRHSSPDEVSGGFRSAYAQYQALWLEELLNEKPNDEYLMDLHAELVRLETVMQILGIEP